MLGDMIGCASIEVTHTLTTLWYVYSAHRIEGAVARSDVFLNHCSIESAEF